MDLILSQRALDDLEAIDSYYRAFSERSADNIKDDIFATINILNKNPDVGRLILEGQLRRVVSAKYRFKISYERSSNAITIIGVFRQQNRQL